MAERRGGGDVAAPPPLAGSPALQLLHAAVAPLPPLASPAGCPRIAAAPPPPPRQIPYAAVAPRCCCSAAAARQSRRPPPRCCCYSAAAVAARRIPCRSSSPGTGPGTRWHTLFLASESRAPPPRPRQRSRPPFSSRGWPRSGGAGREKEEEEARDGGRGPVDAHGLAGAMVGGLAGGGSEELGKSTSEIG
ncbi:unnamed protein product [Urochloa humidicola]